MPVALAIDPGPTRSAYCIVQQEGGRLSYLQGGWLPNASPQWDILFQDAAQNRDLGAIEWLQGYAYEAKRVAQLIETAHEEADLRARARAAGVDLHRITCKQAQGRLLRRETDGDGVIEAVCRAIVHGIPHFPTSSAEHIFSAMVVAVVRLLAPNEGDEVRLPPTVETILYKAREEQALERAERKLRPKKRRETVAQRQKRSWAAKKGWLGR